jgi:hypothetical protein
VTANTEVHEAIREPERQRSTSHQGGRLPLNKLLGHTPHRTRSRDHQWMSREWPDGIRKLDLSDYDSVFYLSMAGTDGSPALTKFLDDPESDVQLEAALILGFNGSGEDTVTRALIKQMTRYCRDDSPGFGVNDTSNDVRRAAATSLGNRVADARNAFRRLWLP